MKRRWTAGPPEAAYRGHALAGARRGRVTAGWEREAKAPAVEFNTPKFFTGDAEELHLPLEANAT